MKKIYYLFGAALAIGIAIQFYRPPLPNPPVTMDFNGPEALRQVLKTSCYNCHSNETNLAWFDQVNPAYWMVRAHVLEARSFLNFSHWDSLPPAKQRVKIFNALNLVKISGRMPLKEYTLLHPEAKMDSARVALLEQYALSLVAKVAYDSAVVLQQATRGGGNPVEPAANGIEFPSDYVHWQAVSTTERWDNNTLRLILGNEVAVKAIQKGENNPYPDGAILAKVVWQQRATLTGELTPGKFVHVEFMIKDAQKYRDTEGWGWARWVGPELKPYGSQPSFAKECINCHKPVESTDYAFTKPFLLTNR